MPFLRVRQAEGARLRAVRSTDQRVARSYAGPARFSCRFYMNAPGHAKSQNKFNPIRV
jgi:hypothetical protein